jgi:hypothetical protein
MHRTVDAIRAGLDQDADQPGAEPDLAAVNRRLAPPSPDVLRRLRDGLGAIGDQS